jgi:UDP-N-acetylmuramate--alanine ligase
MPKEYSKNVIPQLFGHIPGEKPPLVHFIGIGGIGMSSLAQWFIAQNWAISGSDLSYTGLSQEMQRMGIRVKIGHKKSNIPHGTRLVLYSLAVKLQNPELKEAKRLRIPTFSYPEMIGRLTRIYNTIAIGGAHGKSTSTALIGLMLLNADLDPTVIIGTKLKEFDGKNFRRGGGRYLVLEADEYGGAFWHYSPTFIVITNIDREHMDFYKNLDGVKKSFLKFLANAKIGGTFILNKDDRNLFSLKSAIAKIAKSRNIKAIWYSIRQPEAGKIKKIISIPGEHNVSNALAALTLGTILKIPVSQILRSIHKYEGAWRRMEYKGKLEIACPLRVAKQGGRGNCLPADLSAKALASAEASVPLRSKTAEDGAQAGKLEIYDDYAHHPTEIKATLKAFKEKYPRSPLICVFQPHQAERLKVLFNDFKTAFNYADITLILPTYHVAGRDKIYPKFDSKSLVKAIQRKQPKKLLFYLEKPENLKKAIQELIFNSQHPHKLARLATASAKRADSHYVLVMMGAGDVPKYTEELFKNRSN